MKARPESAISPHIIANYSRDQGLIETDDTAALAMSRARLKVSKMDTADEFWDEALDLEAHLVASSASSNLPMNPPMSPPETSTSFPKTPIEPSETIDLPLNLEHFADGHHRGPRYSLSQLFKVNNDVIALRVTERWDLVLKELFGTTALTPCCKPSVTWKFAFPWVKQEPSKKDGYRRSQLRILKEMLDGKVGEGWQMNRTLIIASRDYMIEGAVAKVKRHINEAKSKRAHPSLSNYVGVASHGDGEYERDVETALGDCAKFRDCKIPVIVCTPAFAVDLIRYGVEEIYWMNVKDKDAADVVRLVEVLQGLSSGGTLHSSIRVTIAFSSKEGVEAWKMWDLLNKLGANVTTQEAQLRENYPRRLAPSGSHAAPSMCAAQSGHAASVSPGVADALASAAWSAPSTQVKSISPTSSNPAMKAHTRPSHTPKHRGESTSAHRPDKVSGNKDGDMQVRIPRQGQCTVCGRAHTGGAAKCWFNRTRRNSGSKRTK